MESEQMNEFRPLILVAEDDDSNFKLIKAIIGKKCDIEWAKNGQEIVELFQQHQERTKAITSCCSSGVNKFNTSVIIASRSIEVWFFFLFIIVPFNKFVNFLQRYTSLLSNSLIISLFFKYSFRRR